MLDVWDADYLYRSLPSRKVAVANQMHTSAHFNLTLLKIRREKLITLPRLLVFWYISTFVFVSRKYFFNIKILSFFNMGFFKITYHLPPTTEQTTTDQMHRPPTSKKFEDQKKSEFIFDINYDFKYRRLEIALCIMHSNSYVCFLTNSFLVFLFSRKA